MNLLSRRGAIGKMLATASGLLVPWYYVRAITPRDVVTKLSQPKRQAVSGNVSTLKKQFGVGGANTGNVGRDTTTDVWALTGSFDPNPLSFTLTRVDVPLYQFTAGAGGDITLRLALYDNNEGSPGSELSLSPDELLWSELTGGAVETVYAFDINSYAISSGTTYWMVIYSESIDTNRYARGYYLAAGGLSVKNSSTTSPFTWGAVDSSAELKMDLYGY